MSELSLIERLEAMSADLSVWQLDEAERLMHEAAQALKASASPVQADPVDTQPTDAACQANMGDCQGKGGVCQRAHPPSGKDAEDARRYRFIRSFKDMTPEKAEEAGQAMADAAPDGIGIPTDDQFDSFVDVAIAAMSAGNPDNSEMPNNLPAEGSRG